MKLENIQIKNLRSCKDVTLPFNAYTCLVGPNGAGKSTVLCALNIFFRENHEFTDVTRLVEEDFHQKNTDEPIAITLTFTSTMRLKRTSKATTAAGNSSSPQRPSTTRANNAPTSSKQGYGDREDLVRLLEALQDCGLRREDKAFIAAKQCLFTDIEEIDEFRAFAQFAKTYPEAVPASYLDRVKSQFLHFATQYSVGWDDPDCLRQIAADLEFVGDRLEVEVTLFTERLNEEADQLETERAEMEPKEDDGDGWEYAIAERANVDEMFQSLRSELES